MSDIESDESYLENDFDESEREDDNQDAIKSIRGKSKIYDKKEDFEEFGEVAKKIKKEGYLGARWHSKQKKQTANGDKYWYNCQYRNVNL
jgi:hypothetical protein